MSNEENMGKSQCDVCGDWYPENELRKGNAADPKVICEGCSEIPTSEKSHKEIYIDEKTKKECIIETYRGYQEGVATLCRNIEDGEGYVAVMASSNWSEKGVEKIIDLSDTNGHGGFVAGILGGDISIDVPGHEDILQLWEDSDHYNRLQKELEEIVSRDQKEIDAWVEENHLAFFTKEDAEGDIWEAIVEAVSEIREYNPDGGDDTYQIVEKNSDDIETD